MIGAIPAGNLNRAAAEKIVRRQGGPGLCTDVGYVPLLLEVACGGSTNLVKKSLSSGFVGNLGSTVDDLLDKGTLIVSGKWADDTQPLDAAGWVGSVRERRGTGCE